MLPESHGLGGIFEHVAEQANVAFGIHGHQGVERSAALGLGQVPALGQGGQRRLLGFNLQRSSQFAARQHKVELLGVEKPGGYLRCPFCSLVAQLAAAFLTTLEQRLQESRARAQVRMPAVPAKDEQRLHGIVSPITSDVVSIADLIVPAWFEAALQMRQQVPSGLWRRRAAATSAIARASCSVQDETERRVQVSAGKS